DVRPGGTYRFRTAYGVVEGEFREVEPPERLVQTFQNHLQTLEFEDLGEQTKLTQTMRFETTEQRDTTMQYGVEEGAKGGFARGPRARPRDELLGREIRPERPAHVLGVDYHERHGPEPTLAILGTWLRAIPPSRREAIRSRVCAGCSGSSWCSSQPSRWRSSSRFGRRSAASRLPCRPISAPRRPGPPESGPRLRSSSSTSDAPRPRS